MILLHLFRAFLLVALTALLSLVQTAKGESASSAFSTAEHSVDPALASHVVSLYGIGEPTDIHKWYIIFYDPAISSHGRVVLVTDNQVTKTYPARGGTIYDLGLTFNVARITDDTPALLAAQSYATDHHVKYDGVRALLREKSANKPFYWRITLLRGGSSRGDVYIRAVDDTFSRYVPPEESPAPGFANDVKQTFLGVGGDLEEFFTGSRTVDQ